MVLGLTDPRSLAPEIGELLGARLQVPAIFPAEVTAGLRRMLLRGAITGGAAADARRRLEGTLLRLHPYSYYADRIWELRDNLTVYDAWYVAIAERLGQPLVTTDSGILGAPGLRCELIDAR
jgi:predicted nucleic acid-binding protein